jgi:hypothetical protein
MKYSGKFNLVYFFVLDSVNVITITIYHTVCKVIPVYYSITVVANLPVISVDYCKKQGCVSVSLPIDPVPVFTNYSELS